MPDAAAASPLPPRRMPLLDACGRAGVDVVTGAQVTTLFADPDGRVRGVALTRPDGGMEEIGCNALVLATCPTCEALELE